MASATLNSSWNVASVDDFSAGLKVVQAHFVIQQGDKFLKFELEGFEVHSSKLNRRG